MKNWCLSSLSLPVSAAVLRRHLNRSFAILEARETCLGKEIPPMLVCLVDLSDYD
jgi:hypothetical protein